MKIARVLALLISATCLVSCSGTRSTVTPSATNAHEHTPSMGARVANTIISDSGSIGFVCAYSHRNNDDPIVFPGSPNKSHTHEYFGAIGVNANTVWQDLETLPNTCESDSDYSTYWVPSLFANGSPLGPLNMAVYVRTPYSADPRSVTVPPNGLELMSVRAGWTCARTQTPTASWAHCPRTAITRLILEYPDCWNGKDLRSPNHFAHVASSMNGQCPSSHPVMLPQLVTEVRYDFHGLTSASTLYFSSGTLQGAHGDMIISWDQSTLKRDIESCIVRIVTCDLTWSTQLNK